jgi:hypothetical protein
MIFIERKIVVQGNKFGLSKLHMPDDHVESENI